MTTHVDGVFACGEVVTGPGSCIASIASGHEAAESIHRYLSGRDLGQDRANQTGSDLPRSIRRHTCKESSHRGDASPCRWRRAKSAAVISAKSSWASQGWRRSARRRAACDASPGSALGVSSALGRVPTTPFWLTASTTPARAALHATTSTCRSAATAGCVRSSAPRGRFSIPASTSCRSSPETSHSSIGTRWSVPVRVPCNRCGQRAWRCRRRRAHRCARRRHTARDCRSGQPRVSVPPVRSRRPTDDVGARSGDFRPSR